MSAQQASYDLICNWQVPFFVWKLAIIRETIKTHRKGEVLTTSYSFLFSLDLNAAESGVQHKPLAGRPANSLHTDQQANQDKCAC